VVPIAHVLNESDKNLLNFNHLTHTPTPAIDVLPDITEVEFIRDFRQPCATQAIHGAASNTVQSHKLSSRHNGCPAYDDIDTMTATSQHRSMSELLHHDEDAVDPDGPNDIDVSRMLTVGCNNNDFTIGGSLEI